MASATATVWERTLSYLGLRGSPPLLTNTMRKMSAFAVVVLAGGLVLAVAESNWLSAVVAAIPLTFIVFSLVTDHKRRSRLP